jgi:hypothetical protein
MTAEGGRGDGGSEPDDLRLPVDASLLDPVSGLFAQPVFMAIVDLRVLACRRMLRPLAVAQFEVVEGLPDGPVTLADPAVVAAMLRKTLRAADVSARLSDGTFGLFLEDTPEDGAVWTLERLRRALATRKGGRTLRAGIACYPGHALDAPGVLAAAAGALESARSWPQDRIEVALDAAE